MDYDDDGEPRHKPLVSIRTIIFMVLALGCIVALIILNKEISDSSGKMSKSSDSSNSISKNKKSGKSSDVSLVTDPRVERLIQQPDAYAVAR